MSQAKQQGKQKVSVSFSQGHWRDYCRLMRIDKPIGSLLLLWPTLWALWLSGGGMPSLKIMLVFVLGVFFMRAAGCVVNDYADRKFDGHVRRTANRPLPSGAISSKQAKILFVGLVLASFLLVLTLNRMTILLSLAALALAWVYPFVKRVSNLPQVVLGAAFGWAIPMAYAAVSEAVPLSCWLLFAANICWTVAYDTQYAMVDRDDDLKIGIKSTAILFGRFDNLINGILQLIMLMLMAAVGYLSHLGAPFYWSLLLAAALFAHQHKLTAKRDRDACFLAFRQNNYVGLVLFLGILMSLSNFSF
ncbi:4-hydroxybenzoate octaprenyltransferase [Ewingella americana]